MSNIKLFKKFLDHPVERSWLVRFILFFKPMLQVGDYTDKYTTVIKYKRLKETIYVYEMYQINIAETHIDYFN